MLEIRQHDEVIKRNLWYQVVCVFARIWPSVVSVVSISSISSISNLSPLLFSVRMAPPVGNVFMTSIIFFVPG